MHKLAAITILISATPVLAEPELDDGIEELIVIDDLRRARPPTYEPASVTVIEREALKHSPAPLIDDAIRAVPSVAMFRRSSSLVADPTSQGVNLRGLGPSGVSRALVLRDGIPLNDPFGGWVYWRAIPIGSIERIEIQPSGASSLFGNFGLGGAIALSSRPITQAVEAAVAGGSHGTFHTSVRGADRFGGLGVEIDGERLSSDGFVPIAPGDRGLVDGPAASRHHDAGLRAEYETDVATVRAFGRTFEEDLEAGTLHTTAGARTYSYGASLTVRRAGRIDLAAFGGNQLFEQERARVNADRSAAEPASSQRTPSNNQGASAMWTTRPLRGHTLQLGVDAMRVAGTSTDTLTPPMVSDQSLVERAAGGEQRFLGLFVQDSASVLEGLEVGASVRVDGWQNREGRRRLTRGNGDVEQTAFSDRSELEVSPRFGVLGHASENLALRASIYRAFRAPTLNELYRPFQVGTVLTAANEELRPETLWGGELGTQLVAGALVARATGFYNRLQRPIFNATLPMPSDPPMRQRQNLGRARVAGLELEASWRPSPVWSATVAYVFIDAEVTHAREHPDLVGKRLAQVPHHRAAASLTFDDPRIATVAADVRYTSLQFEDDVNELLMGSFVIVDVACRRRVVRGFSLFATAQNVFDRRYLVGRAGVDTIGQPRTILVGVAFDAIDR